MGELNPNINKSNEFTSLNRDDSINIDDVLNKVNASHGEFVELPDGEVGVIVDKEHERLKLLEVTKNKKLENLIDSSIPFIDRMFGTADDDITDRDIAREIVERDPTSDDARSIMFVKKAFYGFEPCMNGLAPVDSTQVKGFNAAINALKSGQYRLPTFEEYIAQQKQLNSDKKQGEYLDKSEEHSEAQIASDQESLIKEPISAQNTSVDHVVTFEIPNNL